MEEPLKATPNINLATNVSSETDPNAIRTLIKRLWDIVGTPERESTLGITNTEDDIKASKPTVIASSTSTAPKPNEEVPVVENEKKYTPGNTAFANAIDRNSRDKSDKEMIQASDKVKKIKTAVLIPNYDILKQRGVTLTEHEQRVPGYVVTPENTKILAKNFNDKIQAGVDIPVFVEHDVDKDPIGKALGVHFDGQGNLLVDFEFNCSRDLMNVINTLIDKEKFNCVSLSHYNRTLDPVEVSWVAEGARTGTVILASRASKTEKVPPSQEKEGMSFYRILVKKQKDENVYAPLLELKNQDSLTDISDIDPLIKASLGDSPIERWFINFPFIPVQSSQIEIKASAEMDNPAPSSSSSQPNNLPESTNTTLRQNVIPDRTAPKSSTKTTTPKVINKQPNSQITKKTDGKENKKTTDPEEDEEGQKIEDETGDNEDAWKDQEDEEEEDGTHEEARDEGDDNSMELSTLYPGSPTGNDDEGMHHAQDEADTHEYSAADDYEHRDESDETPEPLEENSNHEDTETSREKEMEKLQAEVEAYRKRERMMKDQERRHKESVRKQKIEQRYREFTRDTHLYPEEKAILRKQISENLENPLLDNILDLLKSNSRSVISASTSRQIFAGNKITRTPKAAPPKPTPQKKEMSNVASKRDNKHLETPSVLSDKTQMVRRFMTTNMRVRETKQNGQQPQKIPSQVQPRANPTTPRQVSRAVTVTPQPPPAKPSTAVVQASSTARMGNQSKRPNNKATARPETDLKMLIQASASSPVFPQRGRQETAVMKKIPFSGLINLLSFGEDVSLELFDSMGMDRAGVVNSQVDKIFEMAKAVHGPDVIEASSDLLVRASSSIDPANRSTQMRPTREADVNEYSTLSDMFMERHPDIDRLLGPFVDSLFETIDKAKI